MVSPTEGVPMKAKKTAAMANRIPTSKPLVPRAPRRWTANQKPPAKRSPARPAVVHRTAAMVFPPLLLEGDAPVSAPVTGPGEKYTLGPIPPSQEMGSETAALPEAYGTKRLFLTARDPHWLYAHWDFTREQQARYNQQSADGHLILRIQYAPPNGGLALEMHVHPESRHWFAHVGRAATAYTAEVGYYNQRRKWASLGRSGAAVTPPETISDHANVEFATIPADLSFEEMLALAPTADPIRQPLARAMESLRLAGHQKLPAVVSPPGAPWSPAQERALAEVTGLDEVRCSGAGSLEIAEMLRRELHEEVASQAAAQLSKSPAPSAAVPDVSSPFGGEQSARGKSFWFNVNAELVIYGATERDATVTVGGHPIQLRPDGSFSYRFALPDGSYELPVVAVSADATDGRAAELRFTRATEFFGDVGASPQDPALQPPLPEDA